MSDALISQTLSPELLKVVNRAQREPEGRFHSLAHLIDGPALARAFRRLRKDAAVGVDGVTKEAYGKELDSNLADLCCFARWIANHRHWSQTVVHR